MSCKWKCNLKHYYINSNDCHFWSWWLIRGGSPWSLSRPLSQLCVLPFSRHYRAQFHFRCSSSYNVRMGNDLGAKLIVTCSFTDVAFVPGRGRLVTALRTRGLKLAVVLLFQYVVPSFLKVWQSEAVAGTVLPCHLVVTAWRPGSGAVCGQPRREGQILRMLGQKI